MTQDLPIIIFASSTLQLATFRLSSFGQRDVFVVGNRGIKGDITHAGSILNDPRFLAEIDGIIGDREVEVFLPNALNSLFYLCASHPNVTRISYLSEGRLTKRFLDYQHRNPSHPAGPALRRAFGMVRLAPHRAQPLLYQALCVLLRQVILRPYVHDTAGHGFRTIERRWKSGTVLFHLPIETSCDGVEIVDLLKDLDFPSDYKNHTCLFINPPKIETLAKIETVIEAIPKNVGPLLIQPHPNFSAFPDKLKKLTTRLDEEGIIWRLVTLSGRQEVTIELYGRGLRRFMVHDSTVLDTILVLPDFFLDIRLIRF